MLIATRFIPIPETTECRAHRPLIHTIYEYTQYMKVQRIRALFHDEPLDKEAKPYDMLITLLVFLGLHSATRSERASDLNNYVRLHNVK